MLHAERKQEIVAIPDSFPRQAMPEDVTSEELKIHIGNASIL